MYANRDLEVFCLSKLGFRTCSDSAVHVLHYVYMVFWYILSPEHYVNIVKNMYNGVTTSVKTKFGETDDFEVAVGVHQGSVLSPLLFTLSLIHI